MGDSSSREDANRVFDHYHNTYVQIDEETMRRNQEFTEAILREFLQFIWRKYDLPRQLPPGGYTTKRETLQGIMAEFVNGVNERQIQIPHVTRIEGPVTGTKIIAYKRNFAPYGLSIDVSSVVRVD